MKNPPKTKTKKMELNYRTSMSWLVSAHENSKGFDIFTVKMEYTIPTLHHPRILLKYLFLDSMIHITP